MGSRVGPLGPGFRALWIGSLISNTGDGVRLAALPLLAAQLTSSPVLVGSVTAAQYLPWLTVAPIGGALVDRGDRRRTILATQAWRGLVMLALAWLVASGHAAIWHLALVAFIITAGEILVDPSVVALVPQLVDDDRLDTANSRITTVEIVTNDVAGAPVGATAFGFAPWLPFVVDGVSYLSSVLPFRRLPSDPPAARGPTPTRTGLRAEAAEGFRFLRRHAVLWPLTLATVVYYFGAATGFSLLVLLVRNGVDASAWAFGVVLACGAVGAFAGTLVSSRVSRRLGTRVTLSVAIVAEGLTLVALALCTSVTAVALVWLVGGVPAGIRIPVARTVQQRLTPNRLLGRVNVTARMFTRGVIVAGALVSGTVASVTGLRSAFVLGGAIEIVSAVLLARALRPGVPAATAPAVRPPT